VATKTQRGGAFAALRDAWRGPYLGLLAMPAREEGEAMSRIEKPPPTQAPEPRSAPMPGNPFAANLVLNEMAAQITQEMLDFSGRRMRAQMEFVSSMPVGDMKGMMEAQFRFLAQASQDYAQEIAQVGEMIRKITDGQSGPRG
jgi:hypothetical protein